MLNSDEFFDHADGHDQQQQNLGARARPRPQTNQKPLERPGDETGAVTRTKNRAGAVRYSLIYEQRSYINS